MPSIIGGPFKIVNVSGGDVVFGDVGFIAPKSASKSYSGSGGGLTGDFGVSISGVSSTNTVDVDGIDTNTVSGV
ncbi:spore germination protein [Tumebacillus permanentifrigoris]|uniref:Spore germination protein PF n=1 Tax=Tumebacillus permanentifrigoris TaxID=378543 RepID=A0A316D2P3_9BACL|nr:spore germination protein [Tumebacillus permanentifrigoris]PWK05037.1 spore germination protein PF [Tumebacillus permanentifrigoris]